MSLYLSASLASNRKGRFLQTVAGAIPLTNDWISSPPASGLLLVQAEELTDTNTMQCLYHWAMQAGCAALVINLKAEQFTLLAQLPSPLDWQLVPAALKIQEPGLIALLTSETDQAIAGFTGSADRHQHQAGDVVHTRYIRKHSNSGLLAFTTLPLWSLNLLDHSEILVSWLNWFVDHAGIAERIIEPNAPSTDYTPDKHDLVVLLLLFAGTGMSLQELSEHNAVKLMFDVSSLNIVKRGEMLRQHDFIDEAGITAAGKTCLQASRYWAYAPLLSEQLNTGAL